MCKKRAFTLIELMVVIAIIGLLVTILIPSLGRARSTAKGTVCLSRLRTLGQGFVLYANANRDVMVPGRMPNVSNEQIRMRILGGIKFRPTFLAMMGNEVGIPPFDDPKPSRLENDRFGQPGDRQNYSNSMYVCSETPDWVDERNGSFGYNYQFLGNSRLRDPNILTSYKNWPVTLSRVRTPAACVAIADSMGTAASYSRFQRAAYQDNAPGDFRSGRSENAYGNEGFNLDPPRIDLDRGEAAGFDAGHILRTAVHPRHNNRANILWADVHAGAETLGSLGYKQDGDREADFNHPISFEGDNRLFNINSVDQPWVE